MKFVQRFKSIVDKAIYVVLWLRLTTPTMPNPNPDGQDYPDNQEALDVGQPLASSEIPPENLDSLRALNARLQEEVLAMVTRKEAEAATRDVPEYNEYPLERRKAEIASIIATAYGVRIEDVVFRSIPAHIAGDFSIMVPALQNGAEGSDKQARKEAGSRYVSEIVPDMKTKLETGMNFLAQIEQKGIYLNVTLDRADYVNDTLSRATSLDASYGDSDYLKGQRVVVDFSSPNIAKTMHVGHLRSTIIGQVVINLLNASGAVTYGVNHLGDWGTQFGQLVSAYRRWGKEVAETINPDLEPVKYLATLYSRIKGEIKKEEDQEAQPLTDEGRANFAALEAGDPEVVELWTKFRELSLIEFARIYERLGIHHDIALGESFYEDKMAEVIKEVTQPGKGIVFQAEDGAWVLDFEDVGLKKGIFLTADGRTVYATRDIAAVRHRRKSFNTTDILYVIGTEQNLHMAQILEAAKRIGDLDGQRAEHVSFGMIKRRDPVTGKLAKISSREGAGGLSEILDQIAAVAYERLRERPNMSDEERRKIAEQIGVGALTYSNFTQQRERDMEFDPDAMLDMENQTAPYLQYTCVRLASLIDKIGSGSAESTGTIASETVASLSEDSIQIVNLIAEFPEVIAKSAEKHAAHNLAEYLYNLARAFNLLYSKEHFNALESDKKEAYLKIAAAANLVLRKGLKLLNIQVPEKM